MTYLHDNKRRRWRKKQNDEVEDDAYDEQGPETRSGRELMHVDCFNVIIDALIVELSRQKQAYVEVWRPNEMDNNRIM